MGLQRFDEAAFARRLQSAITLRGLTMPRAAQACGMPLPSLESYVYRQNLPGTRALFQIAQGLDVSADWLLFGGRDLQRAAA